MNNATLLKLGKVVHHIIFLMHYKKIVEIGVLFPTFCGGGTKKITFFFFIFAKSYHSHSMHISVFFSDGMYSVLTILCNYLQMINQITLFMKKNFFLNIDVKIALKMLI